MPAEEGDYPTGEEEANKEEEKTRKKEKLFLNILFSPLLLTHAQPS